MVTYPFVTSIYSLQRDPTVPRGLKGGMKVGGLEDPYVDSLMGGCQKSMVRFGYPTY